MIARLLVEDIFNRIQELDFGYESENTLEDTWRASLDIATTAGLITADQRARIEIEDKNQRTLERWETRLRAKRRWDAMTPEQQERESYMRKSFEAQNKVLQDMIMRSVLGMTWKMPGVT